MNKFLVSFLFIPIIAIMAIWLWYLKAEHTKELSTLIFTVLVFVFAFYVKKIINFLQDSDIELLYILSSIYSLIFILFQYKIDDTNQVIVYYSFAILFISIISYLNTQKKRIKEYIKEYFTKRCQEILINYKNKLLELLKLIYKKDYRTLDLRKTQFQYNKFCKKSNPPNFILQNLVEDECTFINGDNSILLNYEYEWTKILDIFSTENKKESIRLAKKNRLTEKYKVDYKHPSITNIFDIKHKINILNSLQESALNIRNSHKINTTNIDTISQDKNPIPLLIFKSKIIYLYMIVYITLKTLGNILNYFKNVLVSIFILSLFFYISYHLLNYSDIGISGSFIDLVKHGDLLKFALGTFIFAIIAPISYLFYTLFKIYSLDIHLDSKHDNWGVFFKNFGYFTFTFFASILLVITSVTILSSSGLEYNKAFHFISNMILPTLELEDIPDFFANIFDDDIIFGIFIVKIIFLSFMFSLIILFIRQIIERYTELVDDSHNTRYAIPPEFAKFFSYLILSIFTIILLYGALFINYPNLSAEHKSCESYLESNYKTIKNCQIIQDSNHSHISREHIIQIEDVREYCNNIFNGKKNLNISSCSVAMSIESDKTVAKSNDSISSPTRSLSDYLPLSIFLALFGTVIMLATRNLLENYFSGLSLKINAPYEEGERVRVDDSEMLAVETVGFRATTFYGIKSNTHLVIPNHKLTNSIISNYTQPTLDYREKITIYIPDQKHINMNIPREAEKILLLAAFINTGVKKPRLDSNNSFKNIKNEDKNIKGEYNINEAISKYKDKKCNNKNQPNEICERFISANQKDYNEMIKCLEEINEDIKTNWNLMKGKIKDDKENKLFLNNIVKLIAKKDNNDKNIENEIRIIKKLISSILSVMNEYNKNKSFNYHIDDYLVKRKFNSLKYKDKNAEEIKKELDDISKYLVNISYYYFALTKQLWHIKLKDKSTQNKNDYDKASLEILDVPRVTSKHRRDYEGAFWEVSLLVTVELGEQSDEIIHHINMYIDELWDIYDLPSRYRVDDENKTLKKTPRISLFKKYYQR